MANAGGWGCIERDLETILQFICEESFHNYLLLLKYYYIFIFIMEAPAKITTISPSGKKTKGLANIACSVSNRTCIGEREQYNDDIRHCMNKHMRNARYRKSNHKLV